MARCMKRIWRSSSRWRSRSSGAITTNFERSNAMWRSISGSVPLPIEPKPIITIGPSKRPCSWFMSLSSKRRGWVRCWLRGMRQRFIRPQRRNELRERRLGRLAPGRADEAARALKCARLQFARQEPVRVVAAGQPQVGGLLAREAEPAVVGCIADQQHGAMAEPAGVVEGAPHDRTANAAPAIIRVHGERTEQQRRPGNAGRDVPEPDRADDAAAAGSRPSRRRSETLPKRASP